MAPTSSYRTLLVIATLAVASWPALTRAQVVHVLDDTHDRAMRELLVSVETAANGCASSAAVEAESAAVHVERVTGCLVRLTGPRTETFALRVEGAVLAVPDDTPDLDPVALADASDRVASTDLVRVLPAPISLRVGRVGVAAVVIARAASGQRSSNVRLHVGCEGGQPRALTWVAPGVATVEVFVPGYVPEVAVVVSGPAGETRVRVPVFAGAPTSVQLTAPATVARGEDFPVRIEASTELGTEVVPSRLSVRALGGCALSGDAAAPTVSCGRTADETIVALVRMGDDWVPLDVAVVRVVGAAAHAARPRAAIGIAPPPATASPPFVWLVSLRGAVDGWGALGGGAGVGVSRPVLSFLAVDGRLGWSLLRGDLAAAPPNTSSLTMSRHEIDATVGATAMWRNGGFGLAGRLGVGASLFVEVGHVGDRDFDLVGWSLIGVAAAGPRIRVGEYDLGVDLGLRLAGDVSPIAWGRPVYEVFAEVVFGPAPS